VVFRLLIVGIILGKVFPLAVIALMIVPWTVKALRRIAESYESPGAFLPAVKTAVVSHLVIGTCLGISLLVD